jgi:hypothetical protein
MLLLLLLLLFPTFSPLIFVAHVCALPALLRARAQCAKVVKNAATVTASQLWGQFHQHFMSIFFADIVAPKQYKPKM